MRNLVWDACTCQTDVFTEKNWTACDPPPLRVNLQLDDFKDHAQSSHMSDYRLQNWKWLASLMAICPTGKNSNVFGQEPPLPLIRSFHRNSSIWHGTTLYRCQLNCRAILLLVVCCAGGFSRQWPACAILYFNLLNVSIWNEKMLLIYATSKVLQKHLHWFKMLPQIADTM